MDCARVCSYFPWLAKLASLVASGKAAVLEGFALSHAARVAESTGQASAGISVSFAILLRYENASKGHSMMASCRKSMVLF